MTGEVNPEVPAYIKKASQIIEGINLSKEENEVATILERAEARLDAERSDAYNDGKDAGRLEGQLEGRQEEKIQLAKTMLKEGLLPEFVAKCTGLSQKQIEMLH